MQASTFNTNKRRNVTRRLGSGPWPWTDPFRPLAYSSTPLIVLSQLNQTQSLSNKKLAVTLSLLSIGSMPDNNTRRYHQRYYYYYNRSNHFSSRTSVASVRNLLLTLLVTFLLISPLVDATKRFQPSTTFVGSLTAENNNNVMPPSTISDSTVLGELKETIRTQAQEIERLKTDLKAHQTPKPSTSHGVGHGHGGGEPTEEEVAHYLDQPFYKTSLSRVGWLGIFLASLSATAVIMNTFEHTLEKHIELSYFVPLLAGHGGNTGGQTIGTILSALSAGSVKPKHAARVVAKEAMGGAMSGLILGAMVSPVAYKILGVSYPVATVLFFTMPLVSTIAASLGSFIPFLCIFMGLDPSVIAAPAMTSFVDICGLMSYFMIANYIFTLHGLEL